MLLFEKVTWYLEVVTMILSHGEELAEFVFGQEAESVSP